MKNQRSKSWGHAAGVLPDTDRGYAFRDAGQDRWIHFQCAAPKCAEPVTHWTSYRYVTGKAGSVSHATRKVCEHHAQQFASRQGIGISSEPPRPTATQTIIGQFLAGEQ